MDLVLSFGETRAGTYQADGKSLTIDLAAPPPAIRWDDGTMQTLRDDLSTRDVLVWDTDSSEAATKRIEWRRDVSPHTQPSSCLRFRGDILRGCL